MSDLYRDLGLTIVPPRAADAGKSFSDAELECEHGRLPGDTTPPCGCWEEPTHEQHGRGCRASRGRARAAATSGQEAS